MRILALLHALIVLLVSDAFAHESRPLHINIMDRTTTCIFEVKLPNTVSTKNFPLIFLDTMAINRNEKWRVHNSGFRQYITSKDCRLKGSSIKVIYPFYNPALSSIITLKFSDDEEQVLLIPPSQYEVYIPKDPNVSELSVQYAILGVEHIWAGIDHLLFVICLLIIVGFTKRLFITITGFTIAHSITLILSALDVLQLPIKPIEATIALSIIFLCYEIIHHHQDKNSLTYRYPVLVASIFGLLHGLGFAAVLGEIGLPKKHEIEALFLFNVGVEIGQLIFISLLFLLFYFAKRFRHLIKLKRKNVLPIAFNAVVYICGIIASYWMFDRIF